jgi:hypothetical protein
LKESRTDILLVDRGLKPRNAVLERIVLLGKVRLVHFEHLITELLCRGSMINTNVVFVVNLSILQDELLLDLLGSLCGWSDG